MAERKRDEMGRFVPGDPGGPGRPPKKKEEKYFTIFRKIVGVDEFERVTRKLYELALGGDMRAIKLLMAYALGKPQQVVHANITQRNLSAELQIQLDKVYGDREPSEDS